MSHLGHKGAESDIKNIAAVHSQCRIWVISGQTIAGQNPPLSALVQKRTKCCGAANVRYVPQADSCTAAIFHSISGKSTHLHGTHVRVEGPFTVGREHPGETDANIKAGPGLSDSTYIGDAS
jgi:hypothetical protein